MKDLVLKERADLSSLARMVTQRPDGIGDELGQPGGDGHECLLVGQETRFAHLKCGLTGNLLRGVVFNHQMALWESFCPRTTSRVRGKCGKGLGFCCINLGPMTEDAKQIAKKSELTLVRTEDNLKPGVTHHGKKNERHRLVFRQG